MRNTLLVLSLLLNSSIVAQGDADAPAIDGYETAIRPVLKQHCFGCHGESKQRGDIRLDTLSPVLDDEQTAETWRKVVGALNAGDMPPKGEPQVPPGALRDLLATASKSVVDAEEFLAGTKRAFRRMSSREYINTVNDLLGTTLPLGIIPGDHAHHGSFDTQASSLPVASHHVESYLRAGRHAVLEFMQLATANTEEYAFNAPGYPKETIASERGSLAADLRIPPWPGDYRVRIKCWAKEMGKARVMWVHSKRLGRRFIITGTQEKPQTIDIPINTRVSLMRHGLLPYPTARGQVLQVDSFQIVGAVRAETARKVWGELIPFMTEPRSGRMHPRRPKLRSFELKNAITNKMPPDEMAEPLFRRFLVAIQRGPEPNLALLPRMTELFEQARAHEVPFAEAIIDPMAMALTSPDFLYVPDYPIKGESDLQLANRLSCFLWGSAPDAELRELAKRNQLNRDKELVRQFDRMLNDRRFRRSMTAFLHQWFELGRLDAIDVNTELYPGFEDSLKPDMLTETTEFVLHLIKNDLPVSKLINPGFVTINGPLAVHYGLPIPKHPSEFQNVDVPPGSPYGGLLTQGAILCLNTDGNRTSPVHRGVWVLQKLLNDPPPPPPANVAALPVDGQEAATSTARELLASHSLAPQCASCHKTIDPIGFGLEAFDVVGQFRKTDRRQRVDAEGLVIDKKFHDVAIDTDGILPGMGKFADHQEMKNVLASQEVALARSFVQAAMSYGSGRRMGFSDRKTIEEIVKRSKESGYGIQRLLKQIILSEAFRSTDREDH